MFTNELFRLLVAGICNGLLVSLPIGAVSMQAAYRWAGRQYNDALALASGVFMGDIFVAIVVMVLLRSGVVSVTWPFMLSGAALILVMAWVIMRYQYIIEHTESLGFCVFMGFVMTIVTPGNYGTYLLTYGGQFMSVQYLFGVTMVADMGWGDIILLIAMNGMGLIIGWLLYFTAVQKFGMQFKDWFSWLTPRLVAAVGVYTLGHIAYDHQEYLLSMAESGWHWLV